jgi:hypothetical protein
LLFGEIGVVAGVFYFKRIDVGAFACHYVWKRIEAWVAYWDADGVVAFFLQEFDKYAFAVESSFAPSAKFDSVEFCARLVSLLSFAILLWALAIKRLLKRRSLVDASVYCGFSLSVWRALVTEAGCM